MSEMRAGLARIACHLPPKRITNADLVREFGSWTAEKIQAKTGIEARHVAEDEPVSKLACLAAEKLFAQGVDRSEIDMLLLCTETPDYIMPSTACIIHEKLGLSKGCGAFDYNLGCSGYVYGLHMASAMVRSGLAKKVLLLTGDVMTRYIHRGDKSTRTIFGDGFTASLIDGGGAGRIGQFVLGTDGSGVENLIIPAGGTVLPCSEETRQMRTNRYGNSRTRENLYMNGPEVLKFALREVPQAVGACLEKNGLTLDDVDFFVFHQATTMMLERLREAIGIAEEKFVIDLADKGNTISSTIPFALKALEEDGRLTPGKVVLLCGFGVGYSWGATVLRYGPHQARR